MPVQPAPIVFGPEAPSDGPAVEALVETAFGPGRHAKTAERLRESAGRPLACSHVARRDGEAVGAVRLWRAWIGAAPAVFLGPIAVRADLRGHGLGATLVERACEAARAGGETTVILVGDLGFFGPFGFAVVPRGKVRPPGPVDPGRLMWRPLAAGALDGLTGALTTGALTTGGAETGLDAGRRP